MYQLLECGLTAALSLANQGTILHITYALHWRSFSTFSAAEQEAILSRIFAGVHFRTDLTTGKDLGEDVAHFILEHFLQPTGRRRD